MRFTGRDSIAGNLSVSPSSASGALRLTTLALLALLVTGCWRFPQFTDIWADNQSNAPVVIALTFPSSDVIYEYDVPARSFGIVLQGSADIPRTITISEADGRVIDSFETSKEQVGIVIDAAGNVALREGVAIPFRDAPEYSLRAP